MPDPDHYLELAHFNAWANRRVAGMLEALADEDLSRPLRLFSHLLRAERVWLGRLQATTDAALPLWEMDTLSVCRERLEANTAVFVKVISSLTAADVSETVLYTTTQGVPYENTPGDIFSHVFNHGTHHRGQIALLVRAAGHVPLALDYIAYLRRSV